jgi:hypothetical protein
MHGQRQLALSEGDNYTATGKHWQTSPEAHRLFCHSRNSMLYILLSFYLLAITTAQVRKLTEFAGVR